MKVKLKRGWAQTYPELTLGNVYRVFEIADESLRIISDAGEPFLFPARAFEVVDPTRPSNWIEERGAEGELYAAPPELREPHYFFEAFFDYDMSVRQKFHLYVRGLCHAERDAIPDPGNRFARVALGAMTRYIEIDEDGAEVRKVEVFADGRITFAGANDSAGTTTLEARNTEDAASVIDRSEFEVVWDQALDADADG